MKRKYFERLFFFLSMQIFGLPLFAQGELNEQDNLFVTLPKIFVDRNKLHADGNKIDNIIDRLFLGTYYLTVSAESESESFEKETSHFHVQKRGEEIETEMKPIKVPMKEIFKAAEARSLEILQHRMFALAELEKEFRNLENKWHALNPGKNKDDWRKMDRKKVKLDCGPNSNPKQPFHCNLFRYDALIKEAKEDLNVDKKKLKKEVLCLNIYVNKEVSIFVKIMEDPGESINKVRTPKTNDEYPPRCGGLRYEDLLAIKEQNGRCVILGDTLSGKVIPKISIAFEENNNPCEPSAPKTISGGDAKSESNNVSK